MKLICLFLLSFIPTFSYTQEGLVKSYYPNDSLQSEINFERNVREGEARFFYPNGNLKEEVIYVNGKVDGVVKLYNDNGIIAEMFTIENGKREGPTSFYDNNGNWVSDKDFKNGIRIIEKQSVPEKENKTTLATTDNTVKTSSGEKSTVNKTEERLVPPVIKENNFDDDPAYYLSAEVMPEPKEGMAVLQKKLIYPAYAKEHDIEGIVEIRAFIDQNGDVTRAEVEKGIGYGCDDAARITILYTKFNPGLIRGKPVKTQLVIPFEFRLENKD